MNLNKRKYKAKEVEELLETINKEFNEKFTALKEKNDYLIEETNRLKAELNQYKESDKIISSSIKSAQKKAEDLEEQSKLQYKTELKRLYDFKEKWEGYFNYLLEKYPYYKITERTKTLIDNLTSILNGDLPEKQKIFSVESLLSQNNDIAEFDPKAKIRDYIISTEGDGLDLNQVLNPGELDLGELCKEMGLMEKD